MPSTRHRASIALPAVCLVLAACASSEATTTTLAASPSSRATDASMDSKTDAGGTTNGGPTAAPDASGGETATSVDSGERADSTSAPEVGPGAFDGASPNADVSWSQGQCYLDAQCPGGTCNASAPGGICQMCNIGCPQTFDACVFGSCGRMCSSDADCVAGTHCNTGPGQCSLTKCATRADCGTLFDCRVLPGASAGATTYCQRMPCPNGNECTSGSTCKRAAGSLKLCIEDALTFGP